MCIVDKVAEAGDKVDGRTIKGVSALCRQMCLRASRRMGKLRVRLRIWPKRAKAATLHRSGSCSTSGWLTSRSCLAAAKIFAVAAIRGPSGEVQVSPLQWKMTFWVSERYVVVGAGSSSCTPSLVHVVLVGLVNEATNNRGIDGAAGYVFPACVGMCHGSGEGADRGEN